MSGSRLQEDALVHRALSDPSRVRILDVLRSASGGLDAGQLAPLVDLHANTIRSHLKLLEDAGLVTAHRDAHGQQGRPHILFRASQPARRSSPNADGPGFRALAGLLAHQLTDDPEASTRAEEAGRTWGMSEAAETTGSGEPFAKVLTLLDQLGFDPAIESGPQKDQRIVMNTCAFGELADDYDDVVCSAHLGLIRGALAGLGADVDAASLERHPDAGRCVACLEPRDAA